MKQIPTHRKIGTKSQRVLRAPAPPARAQQVPPRPPGAADPQVAAEHPPEARPYSRPLGGPRPGPQRPSGPGSVGAGSAFRRSRWGRGRDLAVGALARREASSCRRPAGRRPFVLERGPGPAAINGLGTRRWPISARARPAARPAPRPRPRPAHASTRAPLRSVDSDRVA